ncbi:MAG: YcaO-like family protein [Candidatus Symbiodolus clandestinus]
MDAKKIQEFYLHALYTEAPISNFISEEEHFFLQHHLSERLNIERAARLRNLRTVLHDDMHLLNRIFSRADLLPMVQNFVDLKVSVVQAVRTSLVKGQISATTGKGWTLNQALCGALGESLERHCAAYPSVFRPEHRQVPLASLHGFGHPPDFTPSEFYFTKELLSNCEYLLPLIEVSFPYHGQDLAKTHVLPHTSGIASGIDLIEATVFGLLEVIERHASSNFFQQFKITPTGALINPSSINDTHFRFVLNELEEHGYDSFIFRIDAILPTYYVAILDTANLGPKFMVSGVSTHFDEREALDGALLEALQAIVIAAQGAREDLKRHAASYKNQSIGNDNPFYRIQKILAEFNPSQYAPTTKANLPASANEALELLLSRLHGAGIHSIYQCDLSQPQWPLCVAKIIVPGMFDTHINPLRKNNVTTST